MSMGFIVMEINLHNVLILQYSCSSTTVCAKHQMINQSINQYISQDIQTENSKNKGS